MPIWPIITFTNNLQDFKYLNKPLARRKEKNKYEYTILCKLNLE